MRLILLNTLSFDIKRCGATWSIFFKYASKEYNNAKITRMSDHFCNAGDSNLAPTAGSAKISDSKKYQMLKKIWKYLLQKRRLPEKGSVDDLLHIRSPEVVTASAVAQMNRPYTFQIPKLGAPEITALMSKLDLLTRDAGHIDPFSMHAER